MAEISHKLPSLLFRDAFHQAPNQERSMLSGSRGSFISRTFFSRI
ncbi:hypothetical protein ACFFTN_06760 [Aminobacter aganoensis]|uniref:Uncharacterized protein n=1 Tax=Aminobacter aganoensis TaxID=83264 RepID=A0A7X0FCS0_9HYPH|nr:hypothetical protein [Aminobacter aganoensis]MBB6357290.1 hypothetical protein [Aminobacter aganoensis]